MYQRKQGQHIIEAKFSSRCAATGNRIRKGEMMLYDYDTRLCYSQASPQYAHHNLPDQQAARQAASEAASVRAYVNAQEEAYCDNRLAAMM